MGFIKWLKRHFGRNDVENNRVVIFIDFDNLMYGLEDISPPSEGRVFSVEAGLNKIIKSIARDVGEIIQVFIFAPPHAANLWGNIFQNESYTIIFCPKIINKEGKEIDTVDSTLIEFGKKMVRNLRGLTHVCLGSGDKDFKPLLTETIRKGLKILVITSSSRSLSHEVENIADKVYCFSPSEP